MGSCSSAKAVSIFLTWGKLTVSILFDNRIIVNPIVMQSCTVISGPLSENWMVSRVANTGIYFLKSFNNSGGIT